MSTFIFIAAQMATVGALTYADNLEGIAWIGMLHLCISAVCIMKLQNEIVSVSILFLLFSFILHLGQYMLPIVNGGAEPTFDITDYASDVLLLSNGKFIIYAHICLSLGIVLYINYLAHVTVTAGGFGRAYKKEREINRHTWQIIALLLLLMGLVFSVTRTIALLRLMIAGGYYNTFQYTAQHGGIKTQLSNIWVLGVIILLFLFKDSKMKSRLLFAGSVLYLFLTMLTGGRIMALMNIVTLGFFYLRIVEKPKGANNFFLLIVGLLLAEYIVDIGLSRTGGIGSAQNSMGSLRQLVAKIFGEFGGTGYTSALAIEHVPRDIPYAYGMTYLFSLLYLFPNFGWASWKITSMTVFTDHLREYTNSGIGGSYIGEAFYNGGYWGLGFILIFGMFLGWFDTKIRRYLIEKNLLKLSAYIGTMPYVFLITRSFFKDIIRPFAWIMVAMLVLYRLCARKGVS